MLHGLHTSLAAGVNSLGMLCVQSNLIDLALLGLLDFLSTGSFPSPLDLFTSSSLMPKGFRRVIAPSQSPIVLV